MKVVGFCNNYKNVILIKNNKVVQYDRVSLETCIGRGSIIELEFGDVIQNSFDKKFSPKEYNVPEWMKQKYMKRFV